MKSNMPPGCSNGGYTKDDKVKHVCPVCGNFKFFAMFYELGGWFYHNEQGENDAFCCNAEMEVADA